MYGNTLLNRHQKQFLRELRDTVGGLPAERWPRIVTLRRWMRRPRFRMAINAIREAMYVEMELMMTSSAASAAKVLQGILNGQFLVDPAMSNLKVQTLVAVVRANDNRQREGRLAKPAAQGLGEDRNATMSRLTAMEAAAVLTEAERAEDVDPHGSD